MNTAQLDSTFIEIYILQAPKQDVAGAPAVNTKFQKRSTPKCMLLELSDMDRLDLQISVPGHPTLGESVRVALLESEELTTMAHDVQRELLGHAAYGDWLSAEIGNVGVFIDPDWVVSIHGRRLFECVVAMSVLISAVGQELSTPVAFKILPQTSQGRDQSLNDILKRQVRRDQVVRGVKWGLTILVSAASGALLQWAVFGG